MNYIKGLVFMAYNYGSRILSNATSSLHAQQAVIGVTGNNIANVDTEGYTRRIAKITNRNEDMSAGLRIGNGVEVGEIQRYSDEYIEAKLRDAVSQKEEANIEDEFIDNIEGLFDLTGDLPTLGSAITDFYSSIDDLTTSPSSAEYRTNLLEKSKTLIESLQSTYNSLASMQDELDARIANEINTVNSLTQSIADLNTRISSIEKSGSTTAYDERDERDNLLSQLAEKMSFNMTEGSDGAVTVTLSNGFALVHGASYHELQVNKTPSFASSTTKPESLSGGTLYYITYDYSDGAGTGEINLTNIIADGSGSIAGMLNVRGVQQTTDTSPFQAQGEIVDVACRIEGITRNLLTKFNEIYLGDLSSNHPSMDLNGNHPDTFGFFTFDGATDTDGDGLPTTADLDSSVTGIYSYTSKLKLAVSDQKSIAAAYGEENPTGSGHYDFATGDGRNMEALSELKSDNTLSFDIAGSSYTFTGTFDEAYNETVNFVGNMRSRSLVNQSVSEDRYETVQNQHDQVSAVSLDEEYTRLISAQQAYQASAKMIRIAQEMFDDIMAMY